MSSKADIGRFLRRLKQGQAEALAATKRGLDAAGEDVLTLAKLYTPIATGDLKASGRTEPARQSAKSITKEIGFGESYAAAVHENIDAHFNLNTNALARAKYLEQAMRQKQNTFGAIVAAEMKKAL